MPLVSDAMVHAAFDYLHDAADAAAKARADKILSEHKRKKVLGKLILECELKTEGQRKAWAESHDLYWQACEEEAKAAHVDLWHMHQKTRAMAVIEAWRTEQSNQRAAGKVLT